MELPKSKFFFTLKFKKNEKLDTLRILNKMATQVVLCKVCGAYMVNLSDWNLYFSTI